MAQTVELHGSTQPEPAQTAGGVAEPGGWRRIVLGVALAALSGLMAGLSFEDFHIWPLIWVAFVPALVAQHHVLPRRWSGLGLAISVGMMFQFYLGPGLSNADLAWYLYIYGFWIAVFVFAMSARSRSFHVRTGYRWFLVSAPLAWVGVDFVRTTLTEVFAGTWGIVAYTMYDRPAFLQPVSVFGVHGLNLLILLVNWAIAGYVIARLQNRSAQLLPVRISMKTATTWVAVTAALVLAWGVASVAMLSHGTKTVRIAAVQPGAWHTGMTDVIPDSVELQHDIDQTRAAAAQGAKLVVWREAGLSMDLRGPEGKVVADLAKENGVYIAAGWSKSIDGKHHNEVATFGPDGTFLGSYGKSHPGTFAGDYSDNRGGYLVYKAPFASFGSIICFDLDFTDSARNVAKRGAQVLAVSSSDVPGIAHKHYTHLVFRAIETRLGAVKADSTFDSAAIDPYGRIIKRHVSKDGSQFTLVADVPIGTGKSPYVSFGDWLGWIAVGSIFVFGGLSVTSRVRRRRTAAASTSEA
jgi:apolipoprotein N-acyltransferase